MTTITTIHQLLPLVEKKAEFIVQDKKDYLVVDYVYQSADTFDDPLLLECRGIKFDKNGLILARPFRKFFNYGENGSGLPVHRPHIITEKLDGSMIHPAMINGRMYFMTRKGHTDVAKKAERFVLSSEREYVGFCKAAINDGWTPIFEYVGPDNRIVLRYDESKLVLLAMRHTIDGHLMDYTDMMQSADSFGVPVVTPKGMPHPQADPKISVQGFIDHVRNLKDAEGFVLYFDDGYMVKVKAEDYVIQHRALDDLSSKKKIVALCCQGFTDDVLPILDDADKAELVAFNDELQKEITYFAAAANHLAELHKNDRKGFALKIAPYTDPKWLSGIVFGIMDGKNARQLVLKAVEKGGYEDIGIKWRGE